MFFAIGTIKCKGLHPYLKELLKEEKIYKNVKSVKKCVLYSKATIQNRKLVWNFFSFFPVTLLPGPYLQKAVYNICPK